MMTNVLFILAIIIYLVINAVSTATKYEPTIKDLNNEADKKEEKIK